MFSSARMRRVLVAVLMAAGAFAGFAAAATHAGVSTDQATCWPTKPGCDQ
ncbi:hypothetical protein [Rhizocola hellebori]|nr:hypothetical protein [Rhizocola hellebori]